MCLFMLIIFTTIRLLKNVMFVCFGKVILVSYVLKPCVVTASCCCIVPRNVHSKSRERAFWFRLPTLLPIRGSSSHVRCERLIMQVTCMIYCSYLDACHCCGCWHSVLKENVCFYYISTPTILRPPTILEEYNGLLALARGAGKYVSHPLS
jgi:hypothetical protein